MGTTSAPKRSCFLPLPLPYLLLQLLQVCLKSTHMLVQGRHLQIACLGQAGKSGQDGGASCFVSAKATTGSAYFL